jgi:hydroxypyruvate isomerase
MSDEFEGLDATEKAGIERALNRCRALAAKIANELRDKRPEHFVDKLSLADFHDSLEHAADVLGQSRPPVENTPAPAEKGSQARDRQQHR